MYIYVAISTLVVEEKNRHENLCIYIYVAISTLVVEEKNRQTPYGVVGVGVVVGCVAVQYSE